MVALTLQPCRLRVDKIVPTDESPLELSWAQYIRTIVPLDSNIARRIVYKIGMFVGSVRNAQTGRSSFFVYHDISGRNSIREWIRKDPTLPERIQTLYRVESLSRQSRYDEIASGGDGEQAR